MLLANKDLKSSRDFPITVIAEPFDPFDKLHEAEVEMKR
jgi:hypothetical protein